MYKIREVKMEDFSELSELHDTRENIHLAANQENMAMDYFSNYLRRNDIRWYTVEKSGEMAAFILFQIDQAATEFHIAKLSIKANYAKKGLDEHLYQKMERLAKQKDVARITANISTENAAIHDFFARNGWVQENQMYVKYL